VGTGTADDLSAAQIFYPIMQCNDVFMLRCDMTQLGIDQRKVNMLAREYCDYPDNGKVLDYLGKDEKGKCNKPVILSHHMLAALDGKDKMSKSNPDAAIFMEDTEAEVNRKIKKAFCPPTLLEEVVTDEKTGEKETLKNGKSSSPHPRLILASSFYSRHPHLIVSQVAWSTSTTWSCRSSASLRSPSRAARRRPTRSTRMSSLTTPRACSTRLTSSRRSRTLSM